MDNIKEPELIPLETIPTGSNMEITVTTDLYVRIQQVMLEGLPFKDLTHFQTCLKEVHSNQVKDPLSYHLQTLLYLCSLIEGSAKKGNLIQKKNFDLNLKKVVD